MEGLFQFHCGFPLAHREHEDAEDDGQVGGNDHQVAQTIDRVLEEVVAGKAIEYDGDQQDEGDDVFHNFKFYRLMFVMSIS